MNRTPWQRHPRIFNFLLLLLLAASLPSLALARYRFEEGDWIAWGDTRQFYDFSVGRTTIYVATDDGILRWDRNRNRWLLPWFSVPGSFDKAILLRHVRKVREDPLTLDVYVKLKSAGWVMRSNGTERWSKVDAPSGTVAERLAEVHAGQAKPGSSVLMPNRYILGPENELSYRFSTWKFSGGTQDDWDRAIFGWTGFGVGTFDRTSPLLELYPGGPGPATALDISAKAIWCSSSLSQDGGWVWWRDRTGDRWQFADPDNVWGLVPADVNALRIGPDETVWMATTEGVMVRSGENWRNIRRQEGLPRSEVYDVEPFGNGAWIATLNGLAFIDESSGLVLRPDAKFEPVQHGDAFYQLASLADTLYAAGGSLLYCYTETSGWKEIDVPGIITAGTVPTALMVDSTVLAVGDRNGFAWRDSSGWHEAFSRQWRDGAVLAIAHHGGYFWLGTDRGLVKYDPVEKDAIRYTVKDGLVGNTVFQVIGEGDWLWLGTDVALVRFYWNAPGRFD